MKRIILKMQEKVSIQINKKINKIEIKKSVIYDMLMWYVYHTHVFGVHTMQKYSEYDSKNKKKTTQKYFIFNINRTLFLYVF